MRGDGARLPVAGEGRERLAQASLGVEPRMRIRHPVHEEAGAAEPLALEPEPREELPMRLEGLGLGG